MPVKKSKKRSPKPKSPASLFGQIIGDAFEAVVIDYIASYLQEAHPDYELLQPQYGRNELTLKMIGGLSRQMDNVVALKDSDDPVALLETKWLKDGRHHNDKGAWILQLREVRKAYATIRGAAAILVGYWTEGVGVMLEHEGGIEMVLVATDEQVYSTLQQPLDEFLGEESFLLSAEVCRKSYPNPEGLLRMATHLEETDRLPVIARSWLNFERFRNDDGTSVTGGELIKKAIDKLLSPLPENPRVKRFEIALQIDTGNTIYEDFEDYEQALEFIERYFRSPKAILSRITPQRKKSKQSGSGLNQRNGL